VTRKPRRQTPSSRGAIAKAAAKMPDARPAALAAKVGVSETTVRRHLGAINGHRVDELAGEVGR
jgi:predicted ArsR family transcriptional regulator